MFLIGSPTTMGLLLGGFLLAIMAIAGIVISIGKNIQNKKLDGGFDIPFEKAKKAKNKRPKKEKLVKTKKEKPVKVKKDKVSETSSDRPLLLAEDEEKPKKRFSRKEDKANLLDEPEFAPINMKFMPPNIINSETNLASTITPDVIAFKSLPVTNDPDFDVIPSKENTFDQKVIVDSGFNIIPPKVQEQQSKSPFNTQGNGDDW